MKLKFKKLCSALLCLVIIAFSVAPLGSAVTYPEGVTNEMAENTIKKTDNLIFTLLVTTQNKSLKELALPEIYSGKTLSALTVGVYKSLSEYSETLSTIGVNISPAAVANKLTNYPSVAAALLQNSTWDTVNLEGLVWDGVYDRRSFIVAAANVLSPFNDLLYALLCGGSIQINPLLGIKGERGYETAIIPTLKALGCQTITAPGTFYADADAIRNTMIEHILDDVFVFLETVLNDPCDRLTSVLPSIAHYFTSGSFDSAVATLVEPLKLQVFNISTGVTADSLMSFISDSESVTQSVTINFNDIMADMGLNVAEINLEEVASLGTVYEDGTVVANKGDVFVWLVTWLVNSLKLGENSFEGMLGAENGDMTEMLKSLLKKPTGEIVKAFFELLNQTKGVKNTHLWTFNVVTPATVNYTANLSSGNIQRVVDGIDDLINQFIQENGKNKNTREALQPQIYSNKIVSEIVVMVYSLFENEELAEILPIIGLDVTPVSLASELYENDYKDVVSVLASSKKFSDIDKATLNWGFKDGSRRGFIKALSAALRPLQGVVDMLLSEGRINLLGCIDIYGSDGYNSAVIPILEALGCSSDSILTYNEYVNRARTGQTFEPILEAICSLIERILDKPVYTVIEILPNLMYFIENDGLEISIKNLLFPLTEMLSKLGLQDMIDFSEFTEIDINSLSKDLLSGEDMGITLPQIDLSQFSTMGQLVTVNSKRTYFDAGTAISYLQADKPAVMMTFLRILVEVMKTPGNEDMVSSFIGGTSSEGGNDMFATFSGGIGEELSAMSVDETVEWLYKIFFRERAVEEEKNTEEYLPTIIYKPEKTSEVYIGVFSLAGFIALGEVIYIKYRQQITEYLKDRKEKKKSKTQVSQEV